MTVEKVALTESEKDAMRFCECGHRASQHNGYGCIVKRHPFNDNVDDCKKSPPDVVDAGVESIVAARVAEAKAQVLREYANEQHGHMAEAWGGDRSWHTTGTKVANVVRDWILEDANEYDSTAAKS